MDKLFISCADAAKILGCDPQAIRVQAHDDPTKLGFKVVVIGRAIKIPKTEFFSYLGISENFVN